VYSNNPPSEKIRLLYLRSASKVNDDLIYHSCTSTTKRSGRHIQGTQSFADLLQTTNMPLYLGWARKSEIGQIKWNSKKSIAVQNIKTMKTGSKKWKNCVKLATDDQVLVLKVEEEDKFRWLVRGLTQIISMVSSGVTSL
jgi:hypothetical protein